MVRKICSQNYGTSGSQQPVDDDIPTSQQSLNELQDQVAALISAVAALSTQNTTPALRPRHPVHTNDNDESEDESNLFAPLHNQPIRHRNNNDNSDSDNDNDNIYTAWKCSFKIKFPKFHGSTDAEELLDWFVTIE